jgi:transcriptional regulator with XRE-family HTH domain
MSDVFSQRLKVARDLRKLSQGELAERSGLQPSAISHFETASRSPSFDNLKKLADALDVTSDFLLGITDQPTASGPKAQALFRHAENVSSSDLELLETMAANMAKKNLERGKK